MQPGFWHERWRLGQIGFHQGVVNQQLQKHWTTLQIANGGVFVPLCGKSLDLVWLRNRGSHVTGIELSAVALELFCLEQGILARRSAERVFQRFESDGLRLFQGDLYNLSRQLLGSVRAVYDRGSLVAFPPDARAAYVEHITTLTTTGTKTLLITVEYPQHQMKGPPFSISPADVSSLYRSHHAIEPLERRDILADEARMRSRGVSELHENCFLLTRR